MTKLITALFIAAFAIGGAQAASHAGAAPMKDAASAPKKADAKKPEAKKEEAKKPEAKKEEAKK